MTIWKYPLNGYYGQLIEMPRKAKILTVQLQDGAPVLWVEVNPHSLLKDRRVFHFIETGTEFEGSCLEYVATVQISANYVIHVFEDTFKREEIK